MKMSKRNFEMIVDAFSRDNYCDIYVVFKFAYTEKELEKKHFELVRLDHDYEYPFHCWSTDWDEGQEFIDLYGIYTEGEVLNMILSKDIKELIKTRLMETALNCVGELGDVSEVLEDIAHRIDLWTEEATK